MELLGKKDAFALSAIAAGIFAFNPILAGSVTALAAAGFLPMLGSALLTHRALRSRISLINETAQENFILPSDETFPECFYSQTGLRMGYTRDANEPVDIDDEFLTRHMAIIGASGVGKTTLLEYILWQQTCRGGGWLFIDAKLDVVTRDKLYWMLIQTGRAADFYVLNIDDPEQSATYNPILMGGSDGGDADEVASCLMNLQPSSENNAGADFYRSAANHALTVLIGALRATRVRYHFLDLAIMLQSASAMEQVERMCPPGEAKMNLQVFLDQFRRKDPKNPKAGAQIDLNKLKEVLGGMTSRIAQFAQGKFGQVFNTYAPEIELKDIILGNKCLLVMLPTMGKDTAALTLAKMILSDLRSAVYKVQATPEHLRPNPPFIIAADEFGSYAIPSIARVFEQARSARIVMMPAFQAFANLSSVSPDFEDIIVQNTWNKVYFKSSSKDTPEKAADIIGKRIRMARSLSKTESSGESAQGLRVVPQSSTTDSGGVSESWRETEEYRVSPEKMRKLGIGEAIVTGGFGSRFFHLSTPRLLFPKSLPTYKVLRRKTSVPGDETCLNFKESYESFLSSGGVAAEAA